MASDEKTKYVFDEIVAQYRDKKEIEPIITQVFTVYSLLAL
jgi:hypothetical protein